MITAIVKKRNLLIIGAILIPIILIVGLFAYSYYRNLPKNIHISNLTDRSATISWVTRRPTTGMVVLEAEPTVTPLKLGSVEGATYYDDRDVNRAQIEYAESTPEGTLLMYDSDDIDVKKKGNYYTHHVTVTDLDPNSEYYFRVGNGSYYFASETVESGESSFKTTSRSEETTLSTPDPTYGKFYETAKRVENIDDAIIYLQVVESESGETSSLISSPASDVGSWYLDLNSALDNESNTAFMSSREYDPNVVYHRAEIVMNPKDMYVTIIPIDQDAPARDLILEELMATQNVQGVSTTSVPPAKDNPVDRFLDEFESSVSDKLVFETHAICCESITCSDGTTFGRDVHTPHSTCEARAEEGCWNHGGVQSQEGDCDVSDVPEASQFCLNSCGIDSNGDGKLASYEANFDIGGQWCECCNQNCGGGFGCEQDSRYAQQCGGGSSQPGGSQPGGSQPGGSQPGGSQPGGSQPGGSNPPGYTPPGNTNPPSTEPPANTNGHLPLMIRWWNYQPAFGPAFLYARASQQEIDGMAAVTGDHTRMLMVFGLNELDGYSADQLKSKGITIWGYNTEQGQGHTPANEFATINSSDPNVNAVALFAKKATAAGFEAIWGPTRHKLDAASDGALNAMFSSGITHIAMQEQKFIESQSASARLAAVQQTISRYDRIAAANGVSDVKYHVQIMETRCPDLQNCVDFVQGLEAIPVDSIAIWANRGIGIDFVNAIRGGGGTGGGVGGGNGSYIPQEQSPNETSGPNSDPSTCTYKDAKYQHGYSYFEGSTPKMFCYGGEMMEVKLINKGEECPAGGFCYCGDLDLMLTEDDSDRVCERVGEYASAEDTSGQCTESNACRGRKIGFEGCVDLQDESLLLTCAPGCQESWSECDKGPNRVMLEERVINVEGEDDSFGWFKKIFANGTDDNKFNLSPSEGLMNFPQSGRYCTLYEDETYCFDITSKEDNLLYIDTNGNEKYDEGTDVNVAKDVSTLEVSAEEVDQIYVFKKGLNLISFNFIPKKQDVTASGFLADLNSGAQERVYSLAKYDNGKWVVVGDRDGNSYRSEDFMLIPGVGYLLKAVDDFEVRLEGSVIIEPVPVYMQTGWNLIGVNGMYNERYSAESLIDSVDGTGTLKVDNVTRWLSDSSQFDGLQRSADEEGEMQTYGYDFPILKHQGYFLRVTDGGGEWKPE